MAKFEYGMTSRRAGRPGRVIAALVAIGFCASACSMIDSFNPFGPEKYKMEITPDTPASKTYDQGLEKLANGSPQEAAKKFTELGKQYPSSDWARKGLLMTTYAQYQAADFTGTETSAERYLKEYPASTEAAYVQYLQANAYYQADSRYLARSGRRGEVACRLPGSGEEISEVRIRRGFEIQDPGDGGPARRQGDVDRQVLSEPA